MLPMCVQRSCLHWCHSLAENWKKVWCHIASEVNVNLNVIDFAIAPLKKEVLWSATWLRLKETGTPSMPIWSVSTNGSCSSRQLVPKLWTGCSKCSPAIAICRNTWNVEVAIGGWAEPLALRNIADRNTEFPGIDCGNANHNSYRQSSTA